ncbi:hypothetical protein PHYBOEH_006165 [Phytophthora boehmeriae]|uniref:No apical meristem-associated C-terminal domain-containing protein n=1 Tax=Phytophthora boehmeriae TaxID=109152 RepID=A0A8T1WH66_9STRA|nr:hypothetical protein PHYBOEH_006165 [Phytophthora boehmeriae]
MAPVSSSATTALTTNAASAFNAEELITLGRSWASVLNIAASNDVTLTGEQLTDLSSDASRLFWLLVRSEFVARSPPSRRRTAHELQTQWEKIRPSVAEFLHFFTWKWKVSRIHTSDASVCRQEALEYAAAAFIEETGCEFQYLEMARKLTYHEKWWSVLSPLLLREKKMSGGGTNMREEVEEDSPVKRQSKRGIVRSRDEDEEGETAGRRVRRRVETTEQSPRNAPAKTSPSMLEKAEMKKAGVMERQLEMEMMTKSDEGLSDEAVEYLRLQRQLILGKLREKSGWSDNSRANGREGGSHSASSSGSSGAATMRTSNEEMHLESNENTRDGDTTTNNAFKASRPRISRRRSL